MSELDLRGATYLSGGVQHQVLEALSSGPKASEAILQVLNHPLGRLLSVADFVTDCLSVLAVEGHVKLEGDWHITNRGIGMLNFLKTKSEKPKTFTVAAKKTYKPSSTDYQGDELKVSTPRKGAYDFLALPSRYGNNFVAHPTAHLAGEQS